MAKVKGQVEYDRWKNGEKLTRSEAILAMCYDCNGFGEGGVDCMGEDDCPLYKFMSYGKYNKTNNPVKERSEKQKINDKKLGKYRKNNI